MKYFMLSMINYSNLLIRYYYFANGIIFINFVAKINFITFLIVILINYFNFIDLLEHFVIISINLKVIKVIAIEFLNFMVII
jgi:hypothetical protein